MSPHSHTTRRAIVTACAVLITCRCADPARIGAPPLASRSLRVSANDVRERVVQVHGGGSIQDAINAAGENATILIQPGTYRENVSVTSPGVRLIGLGAPGAVVLENPGGANDGIRVTSTGAGFELDNVTVRGFNRTGVILVGVDGFRLTRVRTEGDSQYGIFPVRSSHGSIAECSATGAADTGVYVGQSSDIVIRNSTAWGNVVGFELENTTRVSLLASTANDNTVGVLLSLVPGVSVMTAADNVVTHNAVFNNNRPNFGEPDDVAGLLPSGLGILVIGPDRTTIAHNNVTGNISTGVGVVSAALFVRLAGLPQDAYGQVDTNPDGTRVELNVVTGNGNTPTLDLFPGADLLWDGTGVGNCWYQNRFGATTPGMLPACPPPHRHA